MDALLRKFLPTSPALLQTAQARLLEYGNETAVSSLGPGAAHSAASSSGSSGSSGSGRVHFESRTSRRGLNYVIATRAGAGAEPEASSSSSSLLLLHGYGYVCAWWHVHIIFSFEVLLVALPTCSAAGHELTLSPPTLAHLPPPILQRWPGHVL